MPDTDREKALVELLDSTTASVRAADELEPAARAALEAVCKLTGWPLGHLCVPAGSTDGFVSSGIWVGAAEEFPGLREVTARTVFTSGAGIVGRVAATGEPVWSHDVNRDPNFVRAHQGADLGVGAAFAFPVMAADGVVAVLEFFSTRTVPPDAPLMRVMANLGHQLGRVVDRRRAREALEASRARTEQMIETSIEAFIAMDSAGRIIGWNAAAEHMFGIPCGEALGRILADTIIPPRYRTAHRDGLNRFLTTGRPKVLNRRFEITAQRPDGTEFPIELAIWPIRDQDQWLFNAFLHDITDRRRAEEALRAAYEQEQATVTRLKELDQAKNDFIATVSHELRTPLTAISGYLEMLLEGDAGPVPASQQRMLNAMAGGAARLHHLVEELLTANTIDTGKLLITPEPVHVRAVIDRALQSTAELAQRHRHTIDVHLDDDVGHLHADRAHLADALRALLSNAIKASPPGATVTVHASTAGRTTSISVTDTGVGIPAEELPLVFDRFYRTRLATEQAVQGIGLGLTIARSIAEAHGGTITATSTLGEGSTFTLTLPTDSRT
ncbi:PAS domain-containing two-component system sensor histidine kinase/response regulator [Planomonospora sphaerica]|uniref:histidine kinase n=1 Tax=Planomonospora sphaerica TaxID=161355 RepID=A0A171DPW3_9ACTN|nr:ATP-binding protein [Planomonospora sphaerica]GAT71094.1 PAS domain-containing two-component system sensor histidine kinase/response regulator [Planomonospora sphaerica]